MRAFLCKPNFCDDIKRWVLHYEHQISIFLLVLLSNLFGLCQLICNVQTDRSSRWLPATAFVCRYRRPMGKRFFVGSLVALDAYTLKIWINRCEWDLARFLENQVALPLASVTKVEVSWGKKSNGFIGAGIGALVGAGTGAVIGFSFGDDPPLFGEPFLFSAEEKAL